MSNLVIGGKGFLGSHILDRIGGDNGGRSEDNDVYVDITKPSTLSVLDSYDVVVNCVGLSPLHTPPVPYKRIHVEGVQNIVSALTDQQFIHISAAGVHKETESVYLQTKREGEQVAQTHNKTSIIRPGVILGEGSELSDMLRMIHWVRVFPQISTPIQTVNVDTVVDTVEKAIDTHKEALYTVTEEVTTMTDVVRNEVGMILPIPEFLWKPFFTIATRFELFGLSNEQHILLQEGMT